jgi:hypothetical protein
MPKEVNDCLNEYYDYLVETCLQTFEAKLQEIDVTLPTRRRLEKFLNRSL